MTHPWFITFAVFEHWTGGFLLSSTDRCSIEVLYSILSIWFGRQSCVEEWHRNGDCGNWIGHWNWYSLSFFLYLVLFLFFFFLYVSFTLCSFCWRCCSSHALWLPVCMLPIDLGPAQSPACYSFSSSIFLCRTRNDI